MEQVQAVTDAEFLCVCCLLHSNDQVLPLVICFLKKKQQNKQNTYKKLAVQLGKTVCIHRGLAFGT